MSLTLLDVSAAIIREFGGPHYTATATGGTATTVVDATNGPLFPDSWWTNAWVKVTSTTDHLAPEGEVRRVTAFVGATGTWTVGAAFTAAVGAGDTFSVWSGPTPAELSGAISDAVAASFPSFYQLEENNSLTVAEGTYHYAVPATVGRVASVWIATDTTGTSYLPLTGWWVRDDEALSGGSVTSTRYLELPQSRSYTTGVPLRLISVKPISVPASDTGAFPVPAGYEGALRSFLAAYAAALLHERAIAGDNLDQQRTHITRSQQLYQRAEIARGGRMPRLPGTVRQTLSTLGTRVAK